MKKIYKLLLSLTMTAVSFTAIYAEGEKTFGGTLTVEEDESKNLVFTCTYDPSNKDDADYCETFTEKHNDEFLIIGSRVQSFGLQMLANNTNVSGSGKYTFTLSWQTRRRNGVNQDETSIDIEVHKAGYNNYSISGVTLTPAKDYPDDIAIGLTTKGVVITTSDTDYLKALKEDNETFLGFVAYGVKNGVSTGREVTVHNDSITIDGNSAYVSLNDYLEAKNNNQLPNTENGRFELGVFAGGYKGFYTDAIKLESINEIVNTLNSASPVYLDQLMLGLNDVANVEGNEDITQVKVTNEVSGDATNDVSLYGMVAGSAYEDLDKMKETVAVTTAVNNINVDENSDEVKEVAKNTGVNISNDSYAFSVETTKTYASDGSTKDVKETTIPVTVQISDSVINDLKANLANDEELVVASKHVTDNNEVTYETYTLDGNSLKVSKFSDFYIGTRKKATEAKPATGTTSKSTSGYDDGGPFTKDECGNVFDRWGNKIYEAPTCIAYSGYSLVSTDAK